MLQLYLRGDMLLLREALSPPEPPPQPVLDKRWVWHVLSTMLVIVCILRLICSDVAGFLLTCMVLAFTFSLTRDAMREMHRYAMIFGIICILNFLFDSLPLLFSMKGRAEIEVSEIPPGGETTSDRFGAYSVVAETHPFFDKSQGLAYNAQSLAMILSPLSMLLGAYLGISSHNVIQSLNRNYDYDGVSDSDVAVPQRAAAQSMLSAYNTFAQGVVRAARYGEQASTDERVHKTFYGTAQKLDA